jgi:hypothetical protein
MDEQTRLDAVYQYALKVVAENDIIRRKLELVKFVLQHEANTNGTQWVKDLLIDMEQVGRKPDD